MTKSPSSKKTIEIYIREITDENLKLQTGILARDRALERIQPLIIDVSNKHKNAEKKVEKLKRQITAYEEKSLEYEDDKEYFSRIKRIMKESSELKPTEEDIGRELKMIYERYTLSSIF